MAAERTERSRSRDGGQALARGLAILRLLVEANAPMSATSVAAAVGLHPSSASRILATLAEAGYVRKVGYREFAPDYGVFAIAERAVDAFPLAQKPRRAINAIAARCDGFSVSLATMWRGHLIYLLHVQSDYESFKVSFDGKPLHLSSIALRLLALQPDAHALAALQASRARFGWERPTARVPNDEVEVLEVAHRLVEHDVLVLDGWEAKNVVMAAIPVTTSNEPPTALALAGPSDRASVATLRLRLQEGRREVEKTLHMSHSS